MMSLEKSRHGNVEMAAMGIIKPHWSAWVLTPCSGGSLQKRSPEQSFPSLSVYRIILLCSDNSLQSAEKSSET